MKNKMKIIKGVVLFFTVGALCLALMEEKDTQMVSAAVSNKAIKTVEELVNCDYPAPTDYSEDFYREQSESVDVYRQILEGFEEQAEERTALTGENQELHRDTKQYNSSNVFSDIKEEEQVLFPDYYGGSYIEDETGKLVVLVKGEDEKSKKEIKRLTDNSSNVVYKSCDCSYNEMLQTIDEILKKWQIFHEKGIEIVSVEERIMEGVIVITIDGYSNEKENVIRETISCDYLRVEESHEEKKEGATVRAGDGIAVEGDDLTGTYGFAAKRNGEAGFVTAGHVCSEIGTEIFYNETVIGEVAAVSYAIGRTSDSAFVKARGIALSNRVKNNGTIWAASSRVFPENTTVYKYGAKTGRTMGVIKSNNYINMGTKSSNNLGVADYVSDRGDSGAPVLFYEGNYGGVSRYTLLGIHKGRGETGNAIFSHYKNIAKELGVTAITSSGNTYK